MYTMNSTFFSTEMTSSARLLDDDVDVAAERREVCAVDQRSVSARARVAAGAGQAGR